MVSKKWLICGGIVGILSGFFLLYRSLSPVGLILKPNPLSTPELEKLLEPGDLVFQSTFSRQAGPVARATHSPITHVGMVFFRDDVPYVLEAVQPIREIPFSQFRDKGVSDAICIRRSQRGFDVSLAYAEAQKSLGTDYDLLFAWDDSRMYCSELTYKALLRGAGVQIGTLQKIKELDFSSFSVQLLMLARLDLNLSLMEQFRFHQMLFRYKSFERWMQSSDWPPGLLDSKTLEYLNSPILTPVGQFQDPDLKTVYCDFKPLDYRD